jgi:hypothetical protein
MAGLLDFLNTDDARLGIGLLAAGAPQTDPTKTGLGYALQTAMGSVDAQKKAQMAQMLAQSQMLENVSQAQARQVTAAQAARQQAAIAGAFNPDGTFNTQAVPALAQAGVKPEDIAKFAELKNAGRDKVARTVEATGPNGEPGTYQVDDFGNRIGPFMPKWVAPQMVNQGGQVAAVDPVTGKPVATYGVSVSPDSQLSSDTSIRNADQSAVTARTNALMVDEREREKNAQGKAPTEDARKAAGYAIRMSNSLALIDSIAKTNPGAANPGLLTAANNVLPEIAANVLRSEDRQRVEGAQLDALDAALTLNTGAAYTKEQLKGLSKAYFAQPNDGPKAIAEKAERLRSLVETAKLRAGPQLQASIAGATPPAATTAPPATATPRTTVAAPPPGSTQGSKFVTVNGRQVAAQRARNGKLYVPDPNSKSGWSEYPE